MNVATRQKIEKRIIRAIVKDALAIGLLVTVYDGEEKVLKKSDNITAIMKAIMSTYEDTLMFYTSDKFIGSVSLVYGNDGYDVVSDNTVNEIIESILVNAGKIADKCEGDFA